MQETRSWNVTGRIATQVLLVGAMLIAAASPAYTGTNVPTAIYSDSHARGLNKARDQVAQELAAAGITDVNSGHWAAGSFTVLLQAGLLTPDRDGRLNPDAPVGWAEGVSVFARILGVAALTDSPEVALEKAILAGLAETGAAWRPMNRVAVARLLAKALGARPRLTISRETYPFTDFDQVSQTDALLLARMYDLGIFRGYEDGTFRPDTTLTRAELAILVDRIFGVYRQSEG